MENMQYENLLPYEEFKTSQTWVVLDKAVQDLVCSSDIEKKLIEAILSGTYVKHWLHQDC